MAELVLEYGPYPELHPPPPSPRRQPGFGATVFFILVSFPLVAWILFLAGDESDQSPRKCEVLLELNPLFSDSYLTVVLLMMMVLMLEWIYAYCTKKWLAVMAFSLLFFSPALMLSFPNIFLGSLGDKPALGFIHAHSSSSSSGVVVAGANNNNSGYWNNNVKACVCMNEACEDMVYRYYLIDSHNDSFFQGVINFPNYTRVFDDDAEVGRHDLNGTSLKNGDSRYHKVCYTGRSMGKGNRTLCYDCHGCEENYLSDRQKRRWRFSNVLLVMISLLIVSYFVMFVSEVWARYVTWEGASETNEKSVA